MLVGAAGGLKNQRLCGLSQVGLTWPRSRTATSGAVGTLAWASPAPTASGRPPAML